jgi:hypothetical protein
VIQKLEKGEQLGPDQDELHLRLGVLYKVFHPHKDHAARRNRRWRLALPAQYRRVALMLREYYWWPLMWRNVRDHVASCDNCQRHAPAPRSVATYEHCPSPSR